MKFGLLYEMETPRPWHALSEYNIYWEALAQIELADRIGLDYVWEVEHHFLEEYSHSPAPEVFYGAVTQRTKNIRIAHGVRLLPFNFNHPIKIAEQAAVLDIMSNGRVDIGTGRSTTAQELDGFGVNYDRTRDEVKEALEIIEFLGSGRASRGPKTFSNIMASSFRCRPGASCPNPFRNRIHRCGWHVWRRIAMRLLGIEG